MLDKMKMEILDTADKHEEDEIDLLEIFYALKKRILVIIAAGLLAGCIAGVFTQVAVTPVYTSTSSILVLSKKRHLHHWQIYSLVPALLMIIRY